MRCLKETAKKYKALSVTKKSVLWYTLAVMIQNGVLFLATPLYTRILTDSQYGVFSVYQSWQQVVSILAVLALDRCITVGFMKFPNQREAFLSSVQGLMTLLVFAFLLVTILCSPVLGQIIGLPLPIIITMLFVALMNHTLANWSWLKRYQYEYRRLAAVTIFSTVLMQISAILAIKFFPSEQKGEVLVLSMSVVRFILYGAIYISVFRKGKVCYEKEHWRFALRYSVAVIPHALSQIILNSSDRIMIDKMCGREDAAYYGVTYTAAMVLNLIVTSVSASIQPWFFEKIREKKYEDLRKQTNVFLLFAAALAIIVSFFAPEILSILAPGSYQKALWVFPAVAASVFFNAMYLCFGNLESYYEKPVYFSVATTVGAVVNIILNAFFIPRFGFVAAGYTTLFCYMLFVGIHYVFMRKVCRDNINGVRVFSFRVLLCLSLAVIILALGVTVSYRMGLLRYYLMVGMVLVIGGVGKTLIDRIKK